MQVLQKKKIPMISVFHAFLKHLHEHLVIYLHVKCFPSGCGPKKVNNITLAEGMLINYGKGRFNKLLIHNYYDILIRQ